MNSSFCRLCVSLLLWVTGAVAAGPSLQELHNTRSWTAGMNFPTDLALDSQDRAWVVDGLNRRLLVFGSQGGEPRVVPLRNVGQALGIDIAGGRVWLTDTQQHCLHVLDTDGTAVRRIDLPEGCDPVDVLVLENLTVVADNNNHRLLLLDRDARLVKVLGNNAPAVARPVAAGEAVLPKGESGSLPGEFSYPGILSRFGTDFMVVDVLGARVQVLTVEGQLSQVIGRFGVDGESLFRPKGACGCREDGGVWISDGFTGMVLGYDAYGKLEQQLGQGGKPWLFEGPTAVECCGKGLWVVDCRASRLHYGEFK